MATTFHLSKDSFGRILKAPNFNQCLSQLIAGQPAEYQAEIGLLIALCCAKNSDKAGKFWNIASEYASSHLKSARGLTLSVDKIQEDPRNILELWFNIKPKHRLEVGAYDIVTNFLAKVDSQSIYAVCQTVVQTGKKKKESFIAYVLRQQKEDQRLLPWMEHIVERIPIDNISEDMDSGNVTSLIDQLLENIANPLTSREKVEQLSRIAKKLISRHGQTWTTTSRHRSLKPGDFPLASKAPAVSIAIHQASWPESNLFNCITTMTDIVEQNQLLQAFVMMPAFDIQSLTPLPGHDSKAPLSWLVEKNKQIALEQLFQRWITSSVDPATLVRILSFKGTESNARSPVERLVMTHQNRRSELRRLLSSILTLEEVAKTLSFSDDILFRLADEASKLRGHAIDQTLMATFIKQLDEKHFTATRQPGDLATPILCAFEASQWTLFGLLLERNVPDQLAGVNTEKRTVLHLLSNPANIDSSTGQGQLPNRPKPEEIVAKVIQAFPEAQWHKVDKFGDTPFILALKNSSEIVVKAFIEKAASSDTLTTLMEQLDSEKNTPLHLAVQSQLFQVILDSDKSAIWKSNLAGKTPFQCLMDACGPVPQVELLINAAHLADPTHCPCLTPNIDEPEENLPPLGQAILSDMTSSAELMILLLSHDAQCGQRQMSWLVENRTVCKTLLNAEGDTFEQKRAYIIGQWTCTVVKERQCFLSLFCQQRQPDETLVSIICQQMRKSWLGANPGNVFLAALENADHCMSICEKILKIGGITDMLTLRSKVAKKPVGELNSKMRQACFKNCPMLFELLVDVMKEDLQQSIKETDWISGGETGSSTLLHDICRQKSTSSMLKAFKDRVLLPLDQPQEEENVVNYINQLELETGNSALMLAVQSGNIDNVLLLIEMRASIDFRYKDGTTFTDKVNETFRSKEAKRVLEALTEAEKVRPLINLNKLEDLQRAITQSEGQLKAKLLRHSKRNSNVERMGDTEDALIIALVGCKQAIDKKNKKAENIFQLAFRRLRQKVNQFSGRVTEKGQNLMYLALDLAILASKKVENEVELYAGIALNLLSTTDLAVDMDNFYNKELKGWRQTVTLKTRPCFLLDDISAELSLALYLKERGWATLFEDALKETKDVIIEKAVQHNGFRRECVPYCSVIAEDKIRAETKLTVIKTAAEKDWEESPASGQSLIATILSRKHAALLSELRDRCGDYGFLTERLLFHAMILDKPPSHFITVGGATDVQKLAVDTDGAPVCFAALKLKKYDWLKQLLADDAIKKDSNQAMFQDPTTGWTIFHLAVSIGYKELPELFANIRLNSRLPVDKQQNTVLMLAIRRKCKDSDIDLVLDQGDDLIDFSAQDAEENTALHLAFSDTGLHLGKETKKRLLLKAPSDSLISENQNGLSVLVMLLDDPRLLDYLEYLLQSGKDLTLPMDILHTLITVLEESKDQIIDAALLKLNPDQMTCHKQGLSPLHFALKKRKLKWVKKLLESSIIDKDSQMMDSRDEQDFTLLHEAVTCDSDPSILSQIVSRLPDMTRIALLESQGGPHRRTPLALSLASGRVDAAKILLSHYQKSESLSIVDIDESNALHLAIQFCPRLILDILDILKIGSNAQENKSVRKRKNLLGYSPAFQALLLAESMEGQVLLAILDSDQVQLDEVSKENNDNPLHLALKSGHLEVFRATLIRTNSSTKNLTNKDQQSPLCSTIMAGAFDMARILLEDPDTKYSGMADVDFWSPPHPIPTDVIVSLIKVQQTLEKLDATFGKDKRTILHEATSHGRLDVVKHIVETAEQSLLIQKKDNKGNLPMHCAIENGSHDIAEYFIQHPDHRGIEASKNALGQNAIHTAIVNRQASILEMILKCRPSEQTINDTDVDKNTPIHLAIDEGQARNGYACLEILLKLGASLGLNVNQMNPGEENTILHSTIKNEQWDLVLNIVSWGCPETEKPTECPCIGRDKEGLLPIIVLLNKLPVTDTIPLEVFESILAHRDSQCSLEQIAAILQDDKCVQEVCNSKDVANYLSETWVDKKGKNFLYHVAKADQRSLIRFLLDRTSTQWLGSSKSVEAVKVAFEKGHIFMCEQILTKMTEDDKIKAIGKIDGYLKTEPTHNKERSLVMVAKAARESCTKVFGLLIEKSKDIENVIIEDAKTKIMGEEGKSTTILHETCHGGSKRIFDQLCKTMEKFPDLKAQFLNHLDEAGNSALHIASKQPTEEKADIMIKLIAMGVDPTRKNDNNQDFLKVSASGMTKNLLLKRLETAGEETFDEIRSDRDCLKKFIDLGDDELFQVILTKLKSNDIGDEKGKRMHPITLIKDIWDLRKKMGQSYKQLILWEIKHHTDRIKDRELCKNVIDENGIQKCCIMNIGQKDHETAFNEIMELVPAKMGFTYYLKRLNHNFFIVFLLINLFDLIADVTLTVEYVHNWNEFLLDYPSKKDCMVEETIGCLMNDIPMWMPFGYSLAVFLVQTLAETILVTCRPSAKKFRAFMTGTCCCPATVDKVSGAAKARMYWVLLILFTVLQSMATQVYEFIVATFVDYWLSYTGREDVDPTHLVDSSNCPQCRDCLDESGTCVCIQCNRHAAYRKQVLQWLKDNALFLRCKSKRIAAMIENALMPLLQMLFLFPKVVYLFPEDLSKFHSRQATEVASAIGSHWRFIVTALSIFFSLLSMATSLTENYFTKKGKQQSKTRARWTIYFFSIVLQNLGRLMCFMAFTFGYLSTVMGATWMLVGQTIVALAHIVIWSIIFYRRSAAVEQPYQERLVKAVFLGFSSLYVLSEFDLDEYAECFWMNNPKESADKKKTNRKNDLLCEMEEGHANSTWSKIVEDVEKYEYRENWGIHVLFDGLTLVENGVLIGVGTYNITDPHLNKELFVATIMLFVITGLTLKAVYYLFLAPKKNVNPMGERFRKLFYLVVVGYILIAMVSLGYVKSAGFRVTGLTFFSLMLIVALIFVSTSEKMSSMWSDRRPGAALPDDYNNVVPENSANPPLPTPKIVRKLVRWRYGKESESEDASEALPLVEIVSKK